jgi:Peptidase family M23
MTAATFYLTYDSSDPFGNTKPPRTNPHLGSDFPHKAGTPVPSWVVGSVVGVGSNSAIGNYIILRTVLNSKTAWVLNYHLQTLPTLKVGATVTFDQILGAVGDTGTLSSGNHLHVGVSFTSSTAGTGAGLVDPWPHILKAITPSQEEDDEMDYSYIYKKPVGNVPTTYALLSPQLLPGGSQVTTDVKVAEGWSIITRQSALLATAPKFDQAVAEAARLAGVIPAPGGIDYQKFADTMLDTQAARLAK